MRFDNIGTDKYVSLILRLGIAIVFLYFGISQLITPEAFIGWLPDEIKLLPLSPRTFVVLNGGFEIFAASLLALGIYRRITALILGLHLLGITFTIGFTEIGIRDLGLVIATLTIVLISKDYYSLEEFLERHNF